jgi:hypothetical protein
MKSIRYFLIALPVIVFLAACGDSAPLGAGSSDLVVAVSENTTVPDKLLMCSPLSYDSLTQTIGPEGGALHVGPHALTIPPGALSEPVSITAVVTPGKVNTVRFAPAGLTFALPADLTMSYANCNPLAVVIPKFVVQASHDLTAILAYLPSFDEPLAQRVTGRLEHFSTYAVAW